MRNKEENINLKCVEKVKEALMRMRMRYIDDFIEHLWNTCFRKIEREDDRRQRGTLLAGQGGARQQRTLRTAGGTTEDVDEAEDEDEAVAVNRICMGALSISHLQKTTRKTPKKRRPGCLSAGSEYQLPTLRYRGDYGRVLCAVAREKKEKREEKTKKSSRWKSRMWPQMPRRGK